MDPSLKNLVMKKNLKNLVMKKRDVVKCSTVELNLLEGKGKGRGKGQS